jgi:hypothetical protein
VRSLKALSYRIMNSPSKGLLPAVEVWLQSESTVESAVLFGSSARTTVDEASADKWSDIDLHVVTSAPDHLEHLDWERLFPDQMFCCQAVRPATGGVRKATLLFAFGQIDLVLVPASRLRLARWGMRMRLQNKIRSLEVGLNEIHTCVRSGYRFLKGEKMWGEFYARVLAQMPGVRVDDNECRRLADVFLCDLLWLFQKLERRELLAAQFQLHRSLSETNFRLLRELHLRNGKPLPSFGLARRMETSATPLEIDWVQTDARLDATQLRHAAWRAFAGLKALMAALVPPWDIPAGVLRLLERFRSDPE